MRVPRLLPRHGSATRASAARVRDAGVRARILRGMSTDPALVRGLRREVAARGRFDLAVHELLGFFAGAEAAAHIWNELRASRLIVPGAPCVPRAAASFVCPVAASDHDFKIGGSNNLFIAPGAFTLARHVAISAAHGRTRGTGPAWVGRAFEWRQFDAAVDIPRAQSRRLSFSSSTPAVVNGFVTWLWVDVGDVDAHVARRASRTAYPWGDDAVPHVSPAAATFSSRQDDGVYPGGSAARNWCNVFLPLPIIVRLAPGDQLTVLCGVHASHEVPCYTFHIDLNGARLHDITIRNPYPTFISARARHEMLRSAEV